MVTMLRFILLVFLLVPCAVAAQTVTTKEPYWKQLMHAKGYVVGQQLALEEIEQRFPDLGREVRSSWFAFNSTALGESAKAVDVELSNLLGDKWPSVEEKLLEESASFVIDQEFTHQQAVDFLAEVHDRARGDMPKPILATLLAVNPRFVRHPEREINSGWRQTFRTKGHPKAKGVDFSVSFPASWSAREGDRPNIIQFFQSEAGNGNVFGGLIVQNLPSLGGYILTRRDLEEFFSEELDEMIPEGASLIESKQIVLEKLPAGLMIYDMTEKRLDAEIDMRVTQFVTIYNTSMIFIQLMISDIETSGPSLIDLQKKYYPLFMAIANTLVINEKYKSFR